MAFSPEERTSFGEVNRCHGAGNPVSWGILHPEKNDDNKKIIILL
jgi:hypothetical protein